MTNAEQGPISRDEIEAKYNTSATAPEYRNPYLNALGIVTGLVLAIGILMTLVTLRQYGGPMLGLSFIVFGLSLGLFWLLAGAVVHSVRSIAPKG